MKKLAILLFLYCCQIWALETYLPDSIAFKSSLNFNNPKEAELVFDIAPGYDIYADKIYLTTAANSKVKIDTINYPPPISLTNEVIGEYKVYQGLIYIPIPVKHIGDGVLTVNLHFQGCKGLSYCYPGMVRSLTTKFASNNKLVLRSEPKSTIKSSPNFIKNLFDSNPNNISSNLVLHPLITLFGFFIFGLLIAFTPCVFPLLPILLSIIAGKKDQSAFSLALVYILGGACVYALAEI
jgi:thiol:disulfide interchange protein DsbD